MATINFNVKDIYDDYHFVVNVVSDKVVNHTRWSVIHKIIFEKDDKFYQTRYSVGATEMQDESPFEYDDEVVATEVHQAERMMKVWEPIDA